MQASEDNIEKGVGFALIAAILLSFLNLFAKILVTDLDPIMVSFWRNSTALALLTLGLIIMKRTDLMKTNRLKSHIIRAVFGTIGLTLAVWTFQYLPLTEGVVISFTSPLFVIMLSYPLLREKVGKYRAGATLFGLLGVIIMIGFDPSSLNPAGVAVAFGWAFFNGLVLVLLRQLGKTEHALTTVFYFMVIGTCLTALYIPFTEQFIPDESLWWVVAMIGVVGLASLIAKTESFRHAPASIIAPIAYTVLLWTAFIDYFIYTHVATIQTWIGAVIIIAANLFILHRERQKSKTKQIHQV